MSFSIVKSFRLCLCDDTANLQWLNVLSHSHEVAGIDSISKAIFASRGNESWRLWLSTIQQQSLVEFVENPIQKEMWVTKAWGRIHGKPRGRIDWVRRVVIFVKKACIKRLHIGNIIQQVSIDFKLHYAVAPGLKFWTIFLMWLKERSDGVNSVV